MTFDLDLATGIFAFMMLYVYLVIGGGWAVGRLIWIAGRDVVRAFAAHDRKRRRLIAAI